MTSLPHTLLTVLRLDVAFGAMTSIGKTPLGHRRIARVTGGTFDGTRLSGVVTEGADWVINRPDGVMLIDVRLSLRTHDGANIYITYQGRFLADTPAMDRFRKGEILAPSDYSLAIVAKFECGDDRYQWLNDSIVVGTGEQTATGPTYSLYQIG